MVRVYDPALGAMRDLAPGELWLYDISIDHRRVANQEDIRELGLASKLFGILVPGLRSLLREYELALEQYRLEKQERSNAQ